MEILYRLGTQCKHITDFGARRGVSTLAFLAANPEHIVAYNKRREAGMEAMERAAAEAGRAFRFCQQDVLECAIEETDLLLLDTTVSGADVAFL